MVTPSDFLTIALLVALEGLLSADNAMVLAVLVLGLPKAQQKKALRYGILGAFFFRTICHADCGLPDQGRVGEDPGAGYLMYLTYRHFGSGASAEERRGAQAGRAGVWTVCLLGHGGQSRIDRHCLCNRFHTGRRRDVAESPGSLSPAGFSASSPCGW
jgi:hypothetical protein